jgi:hypothetical protein
VVKTGKRKIMLSPETKKIQNQLGEYCRTGILPEIPGIDREHIKHYRRLISNIVTNNIRQAFPVASGVIPEEIFREMIMEFFSRHDAKTSQIWKLPGEFYSYSSENNWSDKYQMPWLNDLLLFEWTELKVHTMPDQKITSLEKIGDILKDVLYLNPDHEIVELDYPVHLTSVANAVNRKGKYYVLIFRKPDDGRVKFINLSVFFAYLIEKMKEVNSSLSETLDIAFAAFDMKNIRKSTVTSLSFIQELIRQGFILGSKTGA